MRIVRRLTICLILFTIIFSNAYAEKQVRLSFVDYPPYYGEHLHEGGPYSEIIKAAFEEEGYIVVREQLPWARALDSTRLGEYDALYTAWYRKDREADFLFSDPLPPNELVLFKRKNEKIAFATLADLKPFQVGIVRGYVNPPGFDEAALKVQEVRSDKQNLQKLANRHIDLAIMDLALGKYILRNELKRYGAMIDWISPPLEVADQFLMFSRKAPDFRKKRDAFNAGLAKIKASGKFQSILDKHDF